MRRPPLRAILVLVVVGLVIGGAWYWWSGRGHEERIGAWVVLVGERDRGGMDARMIGPLAVNGGCLGVHDAAVIWPHGTKVIDDDPVILEVPGNGRVRLGDEVELGGGMIFEPSSDGPARAFSASGVRVPEACSAQGVFLAD